jgi:protein-tyrosine phosphatase
MRILMVCLGNICRSPIAEGILKHKAEQHGLDWIVESAGTNSYHTGEAPHRFSQKVCKQHGIDISGQRARTFTASDFSKYDKIYVLAHDVYDNVQRVGGQNAAMNKVDYLLNELQPGSNESVTDPWYGNEDGYQPVYDIIEQACDAIIRRYGYLKKNN